MVEPQYSVILSQQSFDKALKYFETLKIDQDKAGWRLAKALKKTDVNTLTGQEFLEVLLNTKPPQIFAESSVYGDGTDWNQTELGLLGDISIAAAVTVFDDGAHQNPLRHDEPFLANLLFTPGALLRNDQGDVPADWREVHSDGALHLDSFTSLYRRRLGPVLKWVNGQAAKSGRPALITIPGMGCGQFAGEYRGELGKTLEAALIQILEVEQANLPNIKAVWFDPYQECEASRLTIGHLEFITNPLLSDVFPRPQLTEPRLFGFEDCELYSFVAWDHVSWPGNDYYAGSRATDDGVKAAATDVMRAMTDTKGRYDKVSAKYLPPPEYGDWREVVFRAEVKLKAIDRLCIF